MMRICPQPGIWSEIFLKLRAHARRYPCVPNEPPEPLILSRWVYTNDLEKAACWKATVEWAERNACSHILPQLSDRDYYCVDEPTAYHIGPLGGPLYLPWSFEARPVPQPESIQQHRLDLTRLWAEIVGAELANVTAPLAFTGRKRRRLLVEVRKDASAPWGAWDTRGDDEDSRRAFRQFRAAVNRAIRPHEIDHIEFVVR